MVNDAGDQMHVSDEFLEELGRTNQQFSDLCGERKLLVRAIAFWSTSSATGAPKRMEEYALMLADLEEEIRSRVKRVRKITV